MPAVHLGDAVQVLVEFPAEAALADPGDAAHRDEVGPTALGCGVEEVLHQPQLPVPPDEGSLEPLGLERSADAGDDAHGLVQPDLLRLALQGVQSCVRVHHRRLGGATSRVVDVAAAGRGERLDPRRGVDPVADDEPLLGPLCRRNGARDDPDPGSQLGPGVLGTVGGDGRDELERGPHGALGVVLARHRRSPQRHDGVADELLDDTAVAGDGLPCQLEVAREELAHLLGIALLGERREADEVAEQHRDMAQLGTRRARGRLRGERGSPGRHSRRIGLDGRAALTTESLAGPELRTARRAAGGERAAAVLAEALALRVLAPTRRAAHPTSSPAPL